MCQCRFPGNQKLGEGGWWASLLGKAHDGGREGVRQAGSLQSTAQDVGGGEGGEKDWVRRA